MNDIKLTLDNILNIIGYKGDKEDFYREITNICYLNAVAQLTDTLPETNRESVRKELSDISEQKQLEDTVIKYFTQQEFNEELQKSSETIFKEYIDSIKDTLTKDQLSKLGEYVASLKSQLNQ